MPLKIFEHLQGNHSNQGLSRILCKCSQAEYDGPEIIYLTFCALLIYITFR